MNTCEGEPERANPNTQTQNTDNRTQVFSWRNNKNTKHLNVYK